ncbi:MAG: hypothetical protein RR144_01305 [Clostridia bacterium]
MDKKGSSMVVAPFVLIISLFMILSIGIYLINSIIPFIYYEKLNNISTKYMFVIEKFGYLTLDEKTSLMFELNKQGFDNTNIILEYPSSVKEYGELINFNISYKLISKLPSIENGKFCLKEKETIITVRKNSFSKI